ncbi:SCO2525 family SAM-dependent methyltransferase [Streptomyces sp. NPDC050610]|uniref:SCO2525 family SAM-dependent methyltransferase n=1 Tax=Streptomyces sp. NPDC050610 TaxID=3157097 RepID=UPI0034218EE4
MDLTSEGDTLCLNRDAPWDSFDSQSYTQHNYSALRPDDEEIINVVRDYFSDHFRTNPEWPVSGIDVGAGANLYPALSLLPWCDEITLYERSAQNVDWLRNQIPRYGDSWDPFWQVLCKEEEYQDITNPRARFAGSVTVEEGDLFRLPDRLRNQGVGTMFFVAESLSTSHREFEGAVAAFIGSLAPGAPFAAAFMENSGGYLVGDELFPACEVDSAKVEASLDPHAAVEILERFGLPEGPVREGYTGMVLACGRRGPS